MSQQNKPPLLSFRYVLLLHMMLHSSISFKQYNLKTFRGIPLSTSSQDRTYFEDLYSRGWITFKRVGNIGNHKMFFHATNKALGYLKKTSTYGQVGRLLEEFEARTDRGDFFEAVRTINYVVEHRDELEDLMSYSHLKFLRLVDDNDLLRTEAIPYALYAFQNLPLHGESKFWSWNHLSQRNLCLNIKGWLTVLPKSQFAKILLTLPPERAAKVIDIARQVYDFKSSSELSSLNFS